MKALIFGCDGVLVDHETEGRRRALNRVWQEEGIDWVVSAADARADLHVAGDYKYLLSLRDNPRFRALLRAQVDDRRWPELVAGWHRRLTELCLDTARGAGARTGVRRLAREALGAGWRVVVASVQPRSSMDLVMTYALGPDVTAGIVVVSGADAPGAQTPAADPTPELFARAAASAGADPRDCLVVESTPAGLRAATAAELNCVITPTPATFHADFSEAQLVVTGLGEPDAPPEVIIGGRVLTTARPWCRLTDLEELLAVAPGTRRHLTMR